MHAGAIDFVARVTDLERWCAVGAILGPGGPLDTERCHRRSDGSWDDARLPLHDHVLGRLEREGPGVVPTGTAVLLAGPPGAGKTRLREYLLAQHELPSHEVVDTDEVRHHLIERLGQLGGLPVALDAFRPGGERLTPLELSGALHREARHLVSLRLGAIGNARARNVVIDITLSNEDAGRALVRRLRDLGYERISCVLMQATRPEAEQRCRDRWRRGVARHFAGIGLGERYLSSSVFDTYFPDGPEQARSVRTYESLRAAGPPDGFDDVQRYELARRRGVLQLRRLE